jgi:redox-sensitive bicupin YhaK (pirin superfamily)
MSQVATITRISDRALGAPVLRGQVAPSSVRRILYRTVGRKRGSITRLMSPSDLGELLKPFVFLDRAELPYTGSELAGIHPHSGIATLTTVLQGGLKYEDTTGKRGEVPVGGLEWMKAGRGVWHDGGALQGDPLRVFQLWIALPPTDENSQPESQYISPQEVQEHGPVRVILGRLGRARSVIRAPEGIDYFHIRLNDGERWSYTPPPGYDVAWLAVDKGRLQASQVVSSGQLAVFEQSESAVEVRADGATSFVFGSAVKHPHPLVLGYYSVHTSPEALARGEAEIDRIGERLRAEGRT